MSIYEYLRDEYNLKTANMFQEGIDQIGKIVVKTIGINYTALTALACIPTASSDQNKLLLFYLNKKIQQLNYFDRLFLPNVLSSILLGARLDSISSCIEKGKLGPIQTSEVSVIRSCISSGKILSDILKQIAHFGDHAIASNITRQLTNFDLDKSGQLVDREKYEFSKFLVRDEYNILTGVISGNTEVTFSMLNQKTKRFINGTYGITEINLKNAMGLNDIMDTMSKDFLYAKKMNFFQILREEFEVNEKLLSILKNKFLFLKPKVHKVPEYVSRFDDIILEIEKFRHQNEIYIKQLDNLLKKIYS